MAMDRACGQGRGSCMAQSADETAHVQSHRRGRAAGHRDRIGIGREGGLEGLMGYLEQKTILIDGMPERL